MTLPDENSLRDLVTAFYRLMKGHQDSINRRLGVLEVRLEALKKQVEEIERQLSNN